MNQVDLRFAGEEYLLLFVREPWLLMDLIHYKFRRVLKHAID